MSEMRYRIARPMIDLAYRMWGYPPPGRIEVERSLIGIGLLSPRPGDAIVLSITDPNRKLTAQMAESLKEQAMNYFPEHKVIVLPYGMDLEAIGIELEALSI